MVQSILSNLAVILLGHLLMSGLVDYQRRLSKSLFNILIVVIFSSVIIALFYLPITYGEYRLDLRLIPLFFLAIFRGWKITLPVLIISSTWRLFLGGAGAVPGVLFGMLIPILFVLIFYKRKESLTIKWQDWLMLTICWLISDLPIIFFLPNGLEIFKNIFLIRYISLIAIAFIYHTFVLLAYKNEALKAKLRYLASYDSLTNLLKRETFLEKIEGKINKEDKSYYIAMLDIDYFKKINDTYGHSAGDRVLQQFASLLKSFESDEIVVARYGGEEFIIYLEAANDDQAMETLKKIQNNIRDTSFTINDEKSQPVTASIGLTKSKKDTALHEIIDQADENLYLAKENNRDRLVYS